VSICVTMPNFVAIGHTIADIAIFGFFKTRLLPCSIFKISNF